MSLPAALNTSHWYTPSSSNVTELNVNCGSLPTTFERCVQLYWLSGPPSAEQLNDIVSPNEVIISNGVIDILPLGETKKMKRNVR